MKTWKRGDRALLRADRPQDCERVTIVKAEHVTMTDGSSERWLHIHTATGRLLVHPSHLTEVLD